MTIYELLPSSEVTIIKETRRNLDDPSDVVYESAVEVEFNKEWVTCIFIQYKPLDNKFRMYLNNSTQYSTALRDLDLLTHIHNETTRTLYFNDESGDVSDIISTLMYAMSQIDITAAEMFETALIDITNPLA